MLTFKYQIPTIRLCVKLFKQINIPIIQFPGCPTLIPSWLHQTAVEKLYPGTTYSKPLIKDVLRARRARHECNCNILQSLMLLMQSKKISNMPKPSKYASTINYWYVFKTSGKYGYIPLPLFILRPFIANSPGPHASG